MYIYIICIYRYQRLKDMIYKLDNLDGQTMTFEDAGDLYALVYRTYPKMVIYSDDGHKVESIDELSRYLDGGHRLLVWDSEAESIDDDGSRAVIALTAVVE
jgi:hypothetical protein